MKGDPVMHWTYGLGTIMRLEERNLSGSDMLYYAVQIGDMVVWVPADDKLESRLRPQHLRRSFMHLLTILSGPSETLPIDRQGTKTFTVGMVEKWGAPNRFAA